MKLLRYLAPVFAASIAALPTVGRAQAPAPNVTAGYLDYRSSTANGNPTVIGPGYHAGPYIAGFSTTSQADAQNTALAANFNVFCIDLLGGAGDGAVKVLTFSQAIVDADLTTRYAASGTTGGLTLAKLNESAYLTTKFTGGNVSDWDEIHVALWSLFWKPGTNNLPNYATYDGGNIPTANTWYSEATGVNGSGFNSSAFRVFKPVDANGNFDSSRQIFIASTVPEPSTYLLVGVGLLSVGFMSRRRRKVVAA